MNDKFFKEKTLTNISNQNISNLYKLYQDFTYPEKDYTYQEIYPRVLVYKGLFSNPMRTAEILKNSSVSNSTTHFFKDWQQWGGVDNNVVFGQYVPSLGMDFNELEMLASLDAYHQAQEEFQVIIEVIKNFFAATNHFMQKFNIQKDDTWTHTPPSFCRYIPNTDVRTTDLFMQFHTDYIIEKAAEPGDKFAITTTMYFNDDYEGGEITFKIKGSEFTYKPQAGDLLVFPSGHPLILMEGENPIMHAVNPIGLNGPDRFIVRMFHQIRSEGEDVKSIIAKNIEEGKKWRM
jgi:hypothetical protein